MNVRKLLINAAQHWPAKVLSIAFALALFVFHRMSSLTERFFSVPLVLESQTNLVPANTYPRMIRITIRGDSNSIYHILEEDILAYIDLSRFDAPGNYHATVQIRRKETALDVPSLEIGIDPGEIALTLDYKISKFVPLKANLSGEIETGYILNSYSLNPTQVIIDGPSRLVGYVSELSTETIDLSGRSEDFSLTVNITNQDPLLLIRGNGVTEFRGFISRIITVRNIQSVPFTIRGLSDNLICETDVKNVSVHLEGMNQEALDRFRIPDDFMYMDCSAIAEPGTYMLRVQGNVPPGIILETDPGELMIRIIAAEH